MQISYNDIQVGDEVTVQVQYGPVSVTVTGIALRKSMDSGTWWFILCPSGQQVPCDEANFIYASREGLPKYEPNRPAWLRERDKRRPSPDAPLHKRWINEVGESPKTRKV